MSQAALNRLAAVLATGAEMVASENIGCLARLRMYLAKLGSKLPVRHTLQVRRDAYNPRAG